MRHLFKATVALRATVTAAAARVVLSPEPDLPDNVVRRVSLLVPASPPLSMGIDVAPDEVAGGRNYVLVDLPPSQVVRIVLRRGQFLTLIALEKQCEAGLLVEYWSGEG